MRKSFKKIDGFNTNKLVSTQHKIEKDDKHDQYLCIGCRLFKSHRKIEKCLDVFSVRRYLCKSGQM